MLVQIDGSHHRWLGKDGPRFTLLIAVDDTTVCVAGALFCQEETTRDYFEMLEGLIRRWGIPLALYADRHSVFKQTPGTKRKVTTATQFTRAMDELGIQMVFTRSPQGKGRVERMAGTFQDRLISELRLAGAATVPEAGAVLADSCPASTSASWYRHSSQVPLTPTFALIVSSATSTGEGSPGTAP